MSVQPPQGEQFSARGHTHLFNEHQTCVRCGLVVGLELRGQAPKRGSLHFADEITTHDLSTGSSLRYRLGTDDRILLTLKDREMTAKETLEALHRGGRWRGREEGKRKLRKVLVELDKLAERLTLPRTVQEEVAYIYRKCQQEGLTYGHETRLTLGALVYAVCRRRHISRTLKEICEAVGYQRWVRPNLGFSLRDRGRIHREVRRLKLRLPPTSTLDLAKEYLPRFATKLGLGDDEVRRGLAMLNDNGHHKCSPTVLAGGVLCCLGHLGLEVVAERLGVSIASLSREMTSK